MEITAAFLLLKNWLA